MELNKKDLIIRYTRGTGPGGQHKNKVETCVIIKHIPSGIEEKCEDTRSKLKNYEIALNRVKNKLEEIEEKRKHEKQNNHRKKQIKDKKAIRTYNFPRNEVIDHRSNKKANLKKVLNGDIDSLK